ncbi:hypothetical protein [Brevibacillus invocatus]|uniref:hypothetical protein n=1 Tax=Brevibacillus invocatus TaxID=173959 RepID=UPI00203F63A6|nr:hypothetical protein [Brevibacillus invocatus]MCM3079338.1 hypothetical protein [Brevibacillus invocatus]MCM3429434.1 hypothetical protein [Brevibacillus invocatus]
MKHYLVIGKGEAFTSFVQALNGDSQPAFFGRNPGAYSSIAGETGEAIRRFLPVSFDESYRDQDSLLVYHSVYIFPDEWSEGRDFIALFRQLGTCRIFVMTHEHRHVTLYKCLGANHVIISKQGYTGYGWLAAQIRG